MVSKQGVHWLVLGLFFVSGVAALVYQVLWLRELGLLFGNTAEAAAVTIAVFFSGVAAGGWFWGRRAHLYKRPLREFGILELGVAFTALLFFFLGDAYRLIYPPLHTWLEHSPLLLNLLKATLASIILFPPAFLMGGTFPLLAQHLVRNPASMARQGSLLYALNTLGGMTGAFLAAFVLPMALGFRNAYVLGMGLDLFVGTAAILLARRLPGESSAGAQQKSSEQRFEPVNTLALRPVWLWSLAFLSGALTLAVEVLWTRMYAQVLQNSVYTYATVLILFLLALGLGSACANRLAATRLRPVSTTVVILVLSGLSILASPWLFQALTGGMGYLQSQGSFIGYMARVFFQAGLVIVPAGIFLGMLLPWLLRSLQEWVPEPGRAIGQLIAANTLGAILGALAGGFLFLNLFGLWLSLQLIGLAYLLLALITLMLHPRSGHFYWIGSITALALITLIPNWNRLQPLRLFPGETLIAVSEGSHAHAAVVERKGNRLIRVNNYYRLGGTGAMESERNQGRIPLMLHPDPKDVFFLGLGTGISAGAAIDFPVERIRICELLPEVIGLASAHFDQPAQGLFNDPRVTIMAEDGRNCLMAQPNTYDVIVSDLFTPWKAGTGNLYTVEHYRNARKRLNEGGLFAQWLPLYQVSEEEFLLIARSMAAVFDQVLMWRGDMYPAGPILALVGYRESDATFNPVATVEHGRRLVGNDQLPAQGTLAALLRFYAGNLSQSGILDADGPLNTDDWPLLEYEAPRRQGRKDRSLFIGMDLARFYETLLKALPPEQDPYLKNLTSETQGYVRAGLSYYRYAVLEYEGHETAAQVFLNDFLDRTPFEFAPEPQANERPPTGWADGQ